MTAHVKSSATTFSAHLDVGKMPAHWLMARLGKRVLRPGGLETTRWLLDRAAIGPDDDVVEFAPGLARTAALILARGPRTYTGVERDGDAAESAERAVAAVAHPRARVLHGDAMAVPLKNQAATVVVGEAMLSMQTTANKHAIMREACRLLRPGGRYLIHELAVDDEDSSPARLADIQADLSEAIHVGVRIGTVQDWTVWIAGAGFVVETTKIVPMRLLEPGRLIRDEGLAGTTRFLVNALRTPGAARRLRSVRAVFRRHARYLRAVGILASRPTWEIGRIE